MTLLLPDELWRHIFQQLETPELHPLLTVCAHLSSLVYSAILSVDADSPVFTFAQLAKMTNLVALDNSALNGALIPDEVVAKFSGRLRAIRVNTGKPLVTSSAFHTLRHLVALDIDFLECQSPMPLLSGQIFSQLCGLRVLSLIERCTPLEQSVLASLTALQVLHLDCVMGSIEEQTVRSFSASLRLISLGHYTGRPCLSTTTCWNTPLPCLEVLSLSGAKQHVSSALMAFMPALIELHLPGGTVMDDASLSFANRLQALTVCHGHRDAPVHFHALPALTRLALYGHTDDATNILAGGLRTLTNLTSLLLVGDRRTDLALAALTGLRSLSLTLNDTITGECLTALSNLRNLLVESCDAFNPSAYPPSVTRLEIWGCQHLEDQGSDAAGTSSVWAEHYYDVQRAYGLDAFGCVTDDVSK